ncbi:hypothetical protein LMG29542_08482 [Paraburkholderia humisilvae]|uniref:Uncharacterized protein n=1 Tax=Paraburkholderia humisilvae TaxID=627669 RepID=A0A6J5F8D8_9BURK|nr:hypothetical protein LMG29542_08482 [Paraburkholderia humisilvae]
MATLENGTVAPAMLLGASRIALNLMPGAWILSRSPYALKQAVQSLFVFALAFCASGWGALQETEN